MAEIMTAEFTLADHCSVCIVNTYTKLGRAIANNRRWRWRHAYRCGRRRR